MKRASLSGYYFIVVLLLSVNKHGIAQDAVETIFRNNQPTSTHYFFEPMAAVYLQGNSFKEAAALFAGGKTAWIVNRHFIIGLGGAGKLTPSTYFHEYRYRDEHSGETIIVPNQKMRVGYGYGGLVLGAIMHPYKAVHVSIGALMGGGSANEYIVKENGSHGTTFNSPGFFVVEPNMHVQVNISGSLRLSSGIAYRYIAANNFETLGSKQLSNIGFLVGIKIGQF